MSLVIILCASVLLTILLYRANHYYNFLAMCRRIQAINGRPLEETICTVPGKTIFGNNFDIFNLDLEGFFNYLRKNVLYSKGRSYVLNSFVGAMFNVCTAEDAEQVLQCQTLLRKGKLYEVLRPFIRDGLLISTDKKWVFRRKMLTPTFHFSILQKFLMVFKEGSAQMVQLIENNLYTPMNLEEFIPEFSLNNICDTAMGVKLSETLGNAQYRSSINELEKETMARLTSPLTFRFPWIFRLYSIYKTYTKHLHEAIDFSSKIIQKKREEFQCRETNANEQIDDFGKKRQVALLDKLLEAEQNGLIDHQGICDEVNTFMFGGYDTVSKCVIFSLLNLANHMDMQEKCYEEICHIDDINSLTQSDYNEMIYLDCFIKEVLRMYPPAPVIERECVKDTVICGLLLPAGTQINVHIYDVMRDPRHFPDPSRFDPTRFLPENSVNRHPFAFIPFSAGPRNCIGQKYGILETKVMLVSILKNFTIWPVTRMEDLILESGVVLRIKQNVQVSFQKRVKI